MADNLVRLGIALCIIALVSVTFYQVNGRSAAEIVPMPVIHAR